MISINILLLGSVVLPTICIGKQVSLCGYDLCFSSGLFVQCLDRYNNFDKFKNNVTIVSINDFTPLTEPYL